MLEENKGILLESGTNELEVIVFEIGEGVFGVNVLKVREIIQPMPVTKMPHAHPNVEGIIRLREDVIPVINLAKAIGATSSIKPQEDKLIIAELNKIKVAFHVHSVSRIYRISWEQIEKPDRLSHELQDLTIGVVNMDEQAILLLDYEKVIYDIMPEAGISSSKLEGPAKESRRDKKLLIAEDSPILRKLIEEVLHESGYSNTVFKTDGKETWDYLEKNTQEIDLVITDIEMPTMDGHHLTKKIKQNVLYKHLPVVIFSSLITGDLFHKGERVGANRQISKPEIGKLVENLDELLNI